MNRAVDIYFEIRSRNIPWTTTAAYADHTDQAAQRQDQRCRFGHGRRATTARRSPVGTDQIDVEDVHHAVAIHITLRAGES